MAPDATGIKMKYKEIVKKLKSLANPRNVAGMARFGLVSKKVLGIKKPVMDNMARQIGKNHNLAAQLWQSGIYEARILAALIDDPFLVTEKQIESWTRDFDNWGVCDNACMNLFDKTPFAYKEAKELSGRRKEFVKRTGFALMASLAVHDKKSGDKKFLEFLKIIKRESADDRNYVKKAVNWALRQIGKRNKKLNAEAIKTAKEISKINSKATRWMAKDALRELTSPAVQKRLKNC
jgi:3-methyladenine DNA glycosylase AlkD